MNLPADFNTRLATLYGKDKVAVQRPRWESLAARYHMMGAQDPSAVQYFSAPGRTELGGNHTDHNHGSVLAASINLDTIAMASRRNDLVVKIHSEDYPAFELNLADLSIHKEEEGSSAALVRGVAAWFSEHGAPLCGFDAVVSSTVLRGSGLSSSASYEVLVGTILNTLAAASRFNAVELAIAGQFAENRYFGKPCGLMDQIACAHGGVVAIDFGQPGKPVVEAVRKDFASFGYALVIVAVGDDHADLTHEYAAIPGEMKAVARSLGHEVLAGVDARVLLASAPMLRKEHGDRAFLRALHFAAETRRPHAMVAALDKGDFPSYLKLMLASGHSSQTLLQNLHTAGSTRAQAMDVALAVSELLLEGKGAWRVHGGGFGGTIQALVPADQLASYTRSMEEILGSGTVHELSIRTIGATVV